MQKEAKLATQNSYRMVRKSSVPRKSYWRNEKEGKQIKERTVIRTWWPKEE